MIQELFTSVADCNGLSKMDAALFYAKYLPVFPLIPNTKDPLIQGSWKAYKTQDEATIRAWWSQYPDANIALPMGGEVLCSDLDIKNGEDGWESYQALEPGEITAPMQSTPSGGFHVIHGFVGGLINFTKKGDRGGIDMRTEGGYIVVAPSYVIDEDPAKTGPYKWLQGGEIQKLNGGLIGAYTDWSNESTVDLTIDMPDPTPFGDLAPLENSTLRTKHYNFLDNGEIHESYGGDRSAALLGATMALYQQGFSDADVLGYLENSHGASECAIAHSTERRYVIWLWKYNCLKAREKADVPAKVTAVEAFANITLDAAAPALPTVPATDERERWIAIAESITDKEDDKAIEVYREALRVSPMFGNQVADILHHTAGFRKSDIEKAAKQTSKAIATSMRKTNDISPRRSGEGLYDGHPVMSPAAPWVSNWLDAVGRYVYIASEHKWMDRYTRLTLTPESLNMKESHAMELLSEGDEEAAKLRLADALASRNDTLKVDVQSYWPGVTNDLIHVGNSDAVNTWQPTTLKEVEGDIEPWWSLMCHLFPDEMVRERIADWMGFIVQKQDVKVNYALLVGGGERIGKDTAFQPLMKALGVNNCKDVKAEMLDEKYDDHFIGKKLAVIQEVHRAGFKDGAAVENKLKIYLADPPYELPLRRLGAPTVTQRNLIQLLIFTNFRDAMHLSSNGDRYLCEWSDAKKLTPDFYAFIYDWYDHQQGYEKVFHALNTRDISKFQPKAAAPATPWREEMRGSGKSDLDYQVEDVIDRVRQENEEARAKKAGAIANGTPMVAANANNFHEVLYITPQQIADRINTHFNITAKAVTSILSTLNVPKLMVKNGTDHRFRVPRVFVEHGFAEVPGPNKYKATIKTAVYLVDADDAAALDPSPLDLRLGLCPARLINEYMSSTN